MNTTADGQTKQCVVSPFSSSEYFAIVLAFSVIILMTAIGNSIIIWIVLTTRKMRTVTNYFLVNLAVGDMMSVFQIIPNISYVLRSDWGLGLALCKFSQFFTAFGIAISVLTFTGLTADRYIAIKFPFRPRSTPASILCIISFMWVVSFVIGSPGLIFGTILTQSQADQLLQLENAVRSSRNVNLIESRMVNAEMGLFLSNNWTNTEQNMANCRVCIFNWSPFWGAAYDIALFLLMYILPLTILFATYVPITVKLWSDRGLGEVACGQLDNINSKRKVVKMLISIMVIFGICWLPYQLFFLILHAPINKDHPALPVIFIFCYALAMSNGIYNPIIYCTMNRRFQAGLLSMMSCLPCVKRHRSMLQRSSIPRNTRSIWSPKRELEKNETDVVN